MDYFNYKNGHLHCENIPAEQIARKHGTPTFVYSTRTFHDHYQKLTNAFAPADPLICYAMKSCSNINILKNLANLGAGMDVVSGGELYRAKQAAVPGSKIVYAGVGKSDREITEALQYQANPIHPKGIRLFNIESEAEFENIATLARAQNTHCNATLRINPDVDPHTHKYTTTGKKETKFGIDIDRARAFFTKYGKNPHCKLNALHLHIGSPVYSVDPYIKAVSRALHLIDQLKQDGFIINTLNLGGGFGADYQSNQSPAAKDYANALLPLLQNRVDNNQLKLILEPGRSIAANAGILLTRVHYVKHSGRKRFIIVDAGMQTLIRPALYGSFHFIWPTSVTPDHTPMGRHENMNMPGLDTVDIVGPICESGDFLAQNRKLPPLARGDLLAVFTAGAYGSVMSSRYNSTPLPAEVLVNDNQFQLIRRRETYHDLIQHELPLEN